MGYHPPAIAAAECPRPKLLLSFEDRTHWPILVVLAEDYRGTDTELSEDIMKRLVVLGWTE